MEVTAKSKQIRIMKAIDGQLITRSEFGPAIVVDGNAVPDPTCDLLKLVVINRYTTAPPSMAFVTGFGFKQGAIASSVAHDSHNIVAVGTGDADLTNAINAIIKISGGLSVASGDLVDVLPLPVAGLMSTDSCQVVGKAYAALDQKAKQMGCLLQAPFMTLSFLALLVIPSLKLSDKGLFDVDKFEFVGLFVDS